jgi:ribose transport system substrate-binding protein
VSLFRNTQMRHRGAIAAALGVSAVLALGACSTTAASPGPSDGAATAGGSTDNLVLVQAVRSLSNPYHANWVAGGSLFADSVGLKQVVLSDDGDSQKQLSQIKSLLAGGKKIILNVDPNTSSDTQAIVRAVSDAGGYVVTQWNKPDSLHPWDIGDHWVAHISFDGNVSGHDIAKVLFDKMGGQGGIIALQGILDNVSATQRFSGLQKALAENPGIELLDQQTAGWDRNTGFQVTQTLLTKWGDKVKGVWAANDNMALGALEALKAAGLEGKVPIVGVDAVPEAVQAVQDSATTGYLATVSSDAFWQGGAAISLAYQAATGKFDVAKAPHDQREFFGTQYLVTKDNVANFLKTPTLADLQADFSNPFARSTGPIK